MKPLDYDVRDEFEHELDEIEYCLDGLKNSVYMNYPRLNATERLQIALIR